MKVMLSKIAKMDADIIGMSEIDSLSGTNADIHCEFLQGMA